MKEIRGKLRFYHAADKYNSLGFFSILIQTVFCKFINLSLYRYVI